jgi:hypothetical protein
MREGRDFTRSGPSPLMTTYHSLRYPSPFEEVIQIRVGSPKDSPVHTCRGYAVPGFSMQQSMVLLYSYFRIHFDLILFRLDSHK